LTPLTNLIQPFVEPTDTVLDVGCGIMTPTIDLNCRFILGMDLYSRYLDEIKDKQPVILLAVSGLDRFRKESFDVVLALDLIEHLEKSEGFIAIREMKRICRKHVIIFTPKDFHTNHENVENVWEMGKNPLQEHKSLFSKPELGELGFVRIQTASYPDMILTKYTK